MTSKTWNGATDSYANGADWSPTGVPQSGDTATISTGTVLANSVTLSGLSITVNSGSSLAGNLDLIDSTIASSSSVTLVNPNSYGAGLAPTLAIQGRSVNAGILYLFGTVLNVTFAADSNNVAGALINTGTITLNGASPQVNTAGNTSAVLENDGTINISNPVSGNFESPVFDVLISGTGAINLATRGKIDFGQGASAGQSVNFQGGVNGSSVVQIENANQFHANFTGFVAGNTILVTNTPYTSATYTSNGTSGTLNLYSSGTLEGSLRFSGIYSLGNFTLQYQALAQGGSDLFITTDVQNSTSGSTTPSTAAGPVYRFFDTIYGTHLYTQSVSEAQNIVATRPDLTQETNNFGAVAQTSASAEPVYRFFETSNGTHFFTASQAEFNALTTQGSSNYRPDLTYEASSTFYEDSTQQAGDVAVYRLFDSVHGTQFLTGSQSEYAGLTTAGSSTYRSDLTPEGIAFYAPAGTFHA